ncbi:hypothetical protein DXA52_14900 [Bacteroides thetaiotaomicron]|nr:hypothetical protein DXA52_14900 [Bacteroides thetaiotaomicron]
MEMDINRLVKEYGSYQKRFRLSDCVDEIIELYVILSIEEPVILIVSSSEKRGLLFLHLLFPLLINAVSVSNKLFARLLETVFEFIKNYF